jgi:hypothetical protein
MGSYFDLTIGNNSHYSNKGQVDYPLMTLFKESDKKIISDQRNEDNEEITTYEYSNSVAVIKQRLEIMGFTIEKANEAFASAMNEIRTGEISDTDLWWMDGVTKASFVTSYSLTEWLEAIKNNLSEGINYSNYKELTPPVRKTINKLIYEATDEFLEGFPQTDIRFYVRALLELYKEDDKVAMDYTEMVDSGIYLPSDKLSSYPTDLFQNEYQVGAPIIILTEGSSDSYLLNDTLKVLYPDLSEFYYFLDFGVSNLQGSAGSLVSIVKAFIGAGIQNRFIALFDNDTAAQVAIKGLSGVQIPKQVKILSYPEISLANNYPTIGPQGKVLMNVNGLAGSLEMYFGADVLRLGTTDLTPVQWRGYDQSIAKYQGELLNKNKLQDYYRDKLKKCLQDKTLISNYDWSDMKSIFAMLFNAYK